MVWAPVQRNPAAPEKPPIGRVRTLRNLLDQEDVVGILKGGIQRDDVLVLQPAVQPDLAVHLGGAVGGGGRAGLCGCVGAGGREGGA